MTLDLFSSERCQSSPLVRILLNDISPTTSDPVCMPLLQPFPTAARINPDNLGHPLPVVKSVFVQRIDDVLQTPGTALSAAPLFVSEIPQATGTVDTAADTVKSTRKIAKLKEKVGHKILPEFVGAEHSFILPEPLDPSEASHRRHLAGIDRSRFVNSSLYWYFHLHLHLQHFWTN